MKFTIVPNNKFDLPQYNFDHVKKNPGLYVVVGADKSCLYSAPGMELYYGGLSDGLFHVLNNTCYHIWEQLFYNKITDFTAVPNTGRIKITIKSLPTPNIKLEYGDVILWSGKPHLVIFNGLANDHRGLVNLDAPGLTYSTLLPTTGFTYLGTLTKES